ncbi:MAG: hypothetical protein HWN81_19680 [Candidatus Lokiarchaeota archaeon]|nr:hypothetical protein [Candidatus Lokiarchaeota archaeon]
MIQNIFIFKAGIALVDQNFGQCHALGNDINLISSYLYAIQQISLEITGTSIKSLNFEKIAFHFYRDPNDSNIFYVVVTDVDDNLEGNNFKIHRIAEIFDKTYKNYLQEFHGNIVPFRTFGDILIDMNIAQRNCGGGSECEGCTHNDDFSEIGSIFGLNDD